MKSQIVIFVIVLIISCWLNDAGYQPYPWPTGIEGSKMFSFGTKREERMIPEIVIVDKSRPLEMVNQIEDGEGPGRGELPYALPY